MSKITKLAEEYNLTVEKGLAYGVFEGYMLSLAGQMGKLTLTVAAFFEQSEKEEAFIDQLKQQNKNYGLQEMIHKEYGFSFSFADNIRAATHIRDFLAWLLTELNISGARGADTCPMCQKALSGDSVDVYFRGIACRPHRGCLHNLMLETEMGEEQQHGESKHVGRGALGAFVGGLIGTIPWIIAYYAGWFVGWLGFLIGFAANAGYKKLGGKPCKAKLPVIVAAVLVNVLLSFVLGEALYVTIQIAQGNWHYTFGTIPALTLLIVLDPEFWLSMTPDIVMGLVFAMAGCGSVFSELKSEIHGTSGQIKMLNQD